MDVIEHVGTTSTQGLNVIYFWRQPICRSPKALWRASSAFPTNPIVSFHYLYWVDTFRRCTVFPSAIARTVDTLLGFFVRDTTRGRTHFMPVFVRPKFLSANHTVPVAFLPGTRLRAVVPEIPIGPVPLPAFFSTSAPWQRH